jgi:putative ABC transport system permease protein
MERVQAIGGIEAATYARVAPFSYMTYSSAEIAVDGYQPAPDEQTETDYNEVGPAYFKTLGIPLVSGREFIGVDDEKAAPVAVVNETMAARYWHGRDPVGKRLQIKGRTLRVVGVAKDAKYTNMLEVPKPFFYVPLRQNGASLVVLHLRTRQDTGTIATALAREIHALDPGLALYHVITMQEQMDRQTSPQHVAVVLMGAFGGMALMLAAIGLYGVISYAVSQSTRELALRAALGARAADVLRLVMSRGLTLTGAGLALGLVAGLGLSRLLGTLLYQVSPRDPLVFFSALLVMAVVSGAACLVPA